MDGGIGDRELAGFSLEEPEDFDGEAASDELNASFVKLELSPIT